VKKLNLTLHCGAASVGREEVSRVYTPDPTETWCPVPHHRLIEQVETALNTLDMEVVNQSHALTKDGNRYFGLLQVARANGGGAEEGERERDYAFVAGLRNSHDKSFPAGLAIGAGVFVCDNLSFSGEVQFTRRHTSRILEALPILTAEAVSKLQHGWTKQDARINGYKDQQLTDEQVHDIVIRSLDTKAITTAQLPRILHEWRNPRHDEFKIRNIWSLFNSFTEVMKSTALSELPRRTIKLQGILDGRCDVLWN
jgi:uncharacterized protein DUF932